MFLEDLKMDFLMRLLSRCNLNVRRKTFKQEQEDQQQWVEARNPLLLHRPFSRTDTYGRYLLNGAKLIFDPDLGDRCDLIFSIKKLKNLLINIMNGIRTYDPLICWWPITFDRIIQ